MRQTPASTLTRRLKCKVQDVVLALWPMPGHDRGVYTQAVGYLPGMGTRLLIETGSAQGRPLEGERRSMGLAACFHCMVPHLISLGMCCAGAWAIGQTRQ